MVAHSSFMLDIPIDRQSEEPIYQQLIHFFKSHIATGRLQAGTRLPPSRDLARELGVGRISVVSAYNELQALGLVSAQPGRGTFVSGAETGRKPITQNRITRQSPVPHQNFRELLRMAEKPGVIGFHSGTPPEEFMPVEAFRWAVDTVLERDGAAAFRYEDPEGNYDLRVSTRDYVTSLGIDCRADNILITGGAQQALDLVVQTLLSPGDILLTATPTYIGIMDIAGVRRVQVIGVPTDKDGIRLDALEDILVDYRPRLLYINPTFSNPTGAVMPIHRRRQILRLADQYDLTILEDAVYHELHFGQAPPPPMKALDETGNVIHASGYSKILLPGTRIGYLIAESSMKERLVRVKEAADICTPALNQRAVQMYIRRGGLPAHLDRIRHILRDRRDVAVAAARDYFPQAFQWEVPQGGLYLWLELPADGPTASELYLSAIEHGVAYAVGNLFFPNGDGTRFIRLNFGAQPPAKIREGFKRLSAAWQDFQRSNIKRKPIL